MKNAVIDLKTNQEAFFGDHLCSLHPTFYEVYAKTQKWLARFPLATDETLFDDLFLLYLLAPKNFFENRSPSQIFRLSLSLHLMQKKILKSATFSTHKRHLEIRWIPARLLFPFCSKPVLGCLVGFNLMNRYELFDEENVVLALRKYLPTLNLVKNSVYCHTSQHRILKMFYFEIEKDDHTAFSSLERILLENNMSRKINNSIQTLAPTIFMKLNEEEIYKNVLVLRQEIKTLSDLPQAYIVLDQQTGSEIVFRIILVYISPFYKFSLKDRFFDCVFTPERVLMLRHLDDRSVEAHIFRLSFSRTPDLLRADGSLDFYSARQRVAALMYSAIGEFRDYNGGILVKQQEQLHDLRMAFPEAAATDLELIETFFYALVPLEKQIVLEPTVLSSLFAHFWDNHKKKLSKGSIYSFEMESKDDKMFLFVHTEHPSLPDIVASVLQESSLQGYNLIYNIVNTLEGSFFNAVLLETRTQSPQPLIDALRAKLDSLHQERKKQQVLRMAAEYNLVSLDPRIGGDVISNEILKLLFEGLTRFDKDGNVENGLAETIKVSLDLKEYVFHLRRAFWNDETQISAYDFEYAWKKILSPSFKTAFAYLFHPIKNAEEAKAGLVPPSAIGIYALDERTLKVELAHPTPYFLQLVANTLYSPIHRIVDQRRPQWPQQIEKNYPCSGPFQLKINQPNQGYQLVKNPFYWDAANIKLDQIVIAAMSSAQAFRAFQRKEIDWIGSPLGGWHAFYAAEENDQVVSYPDHWVSWCAFNTAKPPFNHPKLRQAFAYAIDRARIIADSFLPLKPAYSPLPKHLCEKHPFLFPDQDTKKARILFQEALEELGLTKEDISPICFSFVEKGIREHTAACFQQQIEECFGIQCELEPLPWNALFNKQIQGDFQLCMVYWTSRIDDPKYVLNGFRSADLDISFSKWENVEFRHLLDASDKEVNPFQRSTLLLKAQEILCRETPIVPLYYQPAQALVRKDIQVVHRNVCEPFSLIRSFYKQEV
jgi:oligopeptide transport system substrate-binding protein